jgi:hypothetical protein
MIPQLEAPYKQYNGVRETFFERIAALLPTQQAFRPDKEEWNHLQVMEHIVTSEATLLAFFNKYDPALTERKVGLKNKAANLALTQFYRSAKKVKMPAGLPTPTGEQSVEDMLRQAQEVMQGFTVFVEAFPENKINYSVFKHPVSGGMSMKATIEFLGNHILHHNHQLDRIAGHPDFPKG